jgi:arylsulfatase A-like enzyme
MQRRDFLRLAGCGALGAVLFPRVGKAADSGFQPLGKTAAQKPNIVYILADDLGYGDVHALNPQRGKLATPHADRLAREGMAFTDAHGGSSVCTPTRYGILTGRYAWRSRLQSGVLDGYVSPLIAAERLTVPALLKQHGYHTACLGKWHLGFTIEGAGKKGGGSGGKGMGAPLGAVTHDGPLTRGFDHFFGFHHARMMKSVINDARVTELVEPVEMLPKLVRHAAGYIAERAKSGTPFFLYLALNSPHTPIVPSKEWQGKSGLGDYGDFVMETDWAIGEVLAALDQTGLAKTTLVIFTSDNGCSPAAGVDKLESRGHFPSAQFRGYKSDIWDGGHRIPFLARWPGTVKAGSTCAQLACLTDLMATCADLLGAKLPDNAGEDSVSLLPLLRGADQPVREAVVHHSIQGLFALRQGGTKLIFGSGSGGWGKGGRDSAPVQLYDMAQDVAERQNLQASDKATVQRLTKLMEKYIVDGRSTPGAPQKNDAEIKLWKKAGPAGATST